MTAEHIRRLIRSKSSPFRCRRIERPRHYVIETASFQHWQDHRFELVTLRARKGGQTRWARARQKAA